MNSHTDIPGFLSLKRFLPALLCSAFFLLSSCGLKVQNTQTKIETQVREILSLPTFEHVYRDIIYVGEESKFLGITTKDKRALFSIDVIVQAGIDFTQGISVSIPSKNTITVSMPEAEILRIDADESTIHEYFTREKGGAVPRLLYYDEINRKKEVLKEDAVRRGILVKSRENAEKLISNFLHLAGFTQVRFETLKPSNGTEEKNGA